MVQCQMASLDFKIDKTPYYVPKNQTIDEVPSMVKKKTKITEEVILYYISNVNFLETCRIKF